MVILLTFDLFDFFTTSKKNKQHRRQRRMLIESVTPWQHLENMADVLVKRKKDGKTFQTYENIKNLTWTYLIVVCYMLQYSWRKILLRYKIVLIIKKRYIMFSIFNNKREPAACLRRKSNGWILIFCPPKISTFCKVHFVTHLVPINAK